ncbi:hypothetical protein BDY24DRAFT_442174 [Mrakia frigida]|uniref:uncharacterized protein n=1 Tax=Mrakia frigida TaxID=29902 RepID=UPI003FCBF236
MTSSLPNYAGPHRPDRHALALPSSSSSSSSSSSRPPTYRSTTTSPIGPNRRPSQKLVPTIEKKTALARRRQLAASMLGQSVSLEERERGGGVVGRASSSSATAGKNVGSWVAGVEKEGMPTLKEVEGGEGGVSRGTESATTTRQREASAVSDLRALLEKALLEVSPSEPQPAITPPHFPPPPIKSNPPPAIPQPANDCSSSDEEEEDWLVVRPRAGRDATRTTKNSLNPSTGTFPSRPLNKEGIAAPFTSVPRRIFPQRSSTEPTSTVPPTSPSPSTSSRPLPSLPPPPYLRSIATDTASLPTGQTKDAYSHHASLFAVPDSKSPSSLPPPPPFRSHSSPPATSTGTSFAAEASSVAVLAPWDQEDEQAGGEGNGSGGAGGVAKLRSLFFAGKLGRTRKEELLELAYTKNGESREIEQPQPPHLLSSLLPTSFSLLNPFRRSSSSTDPAEGGGPPITPYTFGTSNSPSLHDDLPSANVEGNENEHDASGGGDSDAPIVSRLPGGSTSGAYLTHGEISDRLDNMQDSEARRVGGLWLV